MAAANIAQSFVIMNALCKDDVSDWYDDVDLMDINALLLLFRDTQKAKFLYTLVRGQYKTETEQDRRFMCNLMLCLARDLVAHNNDSPYIKILEECIATGAVFRVNVITVLADGEEELYQHEVYPHAMTQSASHWNQIVMWTFWNWLTVNSWILFWFVHTPKELCVNWSSQCNALSVEQIQMKRDLYNCLSPLLETPEALLRAWQVFGTHEGFCGYVDISMTQTDGKSYRMKRAEQRLVALTGIGKNKTVPEALIRAALSYDPDTQVIYVLRMGKDHISVFVMAKNMATVCVGENGELVHDCNEEPEGPIQSLPVESCLKKIDKDLPSSSKLNSAAVSSNTGKN